MARVLRMAGVVGLAGVRLDSLRELPIFSLVEVGWKAGTKEGDSPVDERGEDSRQVPEYHGTREIPWESGGTTPQG